MYASRRTLAGARLREPANFRLIAWSLRIGAFCCFVGHGAFGFLRKPAWLPYFAYAGIGKETALQLMPFVGLLDVTMGVLVLLWPMPAVLYWMSAWSIWTALLRPLTGESIWEAFERAGNYGAPIALLVLAGMHQRAALTTRLSFDRTADRDVQRALIIFTVMLLAGHGALGLLSKSSQVANYAALVGTVRAADVTRICGALEIGCAALLAFRPAVPLALGVAIWKLLTELLFVLAGAPAWEVIERGGSYAVPFALALVLLFSRSARTHE